jgi:hypothetical protein
MKAINQKTATHRKETSAKFPRMQMARTTKY